MSMTMNGVTPEEIRFLAAGLVSLLDEIGLEAITREMLDQADEILSQASEDHPDDDEFDEWIKETIRKGLNV